MHHAQGAAMPGGVGQAEMLFEKARLQMDATVVEELETLLKLSLIHI